jgi:hypothetical protein
MRVEAFRPRSKRTAAWSVGERFASALIVLCAISYVSYLAHSEAVRSFIGTILSVSSAALRLVAG